MFELVQCRDSGIVHETMDYDTVVMKFRSTHAEASVNGWIMTSRSGDVLEVTKTLLLICLE